MRRLLPIVLLLHPDDLLVQSVRQALPQNLSALRVADWKALLESARVVPPGSMVVVDPFLDVPSAKDTAPEPAVGLRDLRNRFPLLPIIAAWKVRAEHHRQIRLLGGWGVSDVLDLGATPSPGTLQRRLARARQGVAQRVLPPESLPPLPTEARALLYRALDVSMRGVLAQEWARQEGASARTLVRRCEHMALPPPRRLLSWMRVLLGAALIDSPGHTLASAAAISSYAADMPLRRAIENLVGQPLSEIRHAGALRTTRSAFLREVAARIEVSPPREPRPRGRPRR